MPLIGLRRGSKQPITICLATGNQHQECIEHANVASAAWCAPQQTAILPPSEAPIRSAVNLGFHRFFLSISRKWRAKRLKGHYLDLTEPNEGTAIVISQQPRPSAKIYQFPFTATAAGRGAQDKRVVDPRSEYDLGIDFGGGWYHEAALREADRNRKQ